MLGRVVMGVTIYKKKKFNFFPPRSIICLYSTRIKEDNAPISLRCSGTSKKRPQFANPMKLHWTNQLYFGKRTNGITTIKACFHVILFNGNKNF